MDLTGIDDDEIDSMLLSKDEIKTKAKLWLRANRDWLKEQKEKDDQRQKAKEDNKGVEPKPKKTVSFLLLLLFCFIVIFLEKIINILYFFKPF